MQITHQEKLDSGLAALKIAMGMAETSKKRAVQGDVIVQETEEDLARIQARILETGKDTVALERQESAIQLQLGLMAKGGGCLCGQSLLSTPFALGMTTSCLRFNCNLVVIANSGFIALMLLLPRASTPSTLSAWLRV
jgi:hypothetical protein